MAQNATLDDFILTEAFTPGFHQKLKEDESPPGSAVSGSKNFSLDDDGKWETRPGSSLFSTASTLSGNATSSGRLRRRDGTEIPVIAFGSQTKYYNTVTSSWAVLNTGLTSEAVMGFCPNDRNTDSVNRLIMCNGVEAYRIWNGIVGSVSSVTATTIVLTGSTTLANRGFTATGDLSVTLNGTAYNYTGLSGSTFTGVTPDPSAGGVVAGDPVAQLPVNYASNPVGNILLATDNARTLVGAVRPNATFVGGGQVYGSKTNDPTDFAFSTPRVATDGFILNVSEGGGQITGMAQFEDLHYVFKRSTIKRLSFSTDGNDIVQMQSLSSYDERTSSDDGSVSAQAVFRGDDSIIFVSPTNTINTISRVENIDYPQRIPISDPIKSYVDGMVFDGATAGISWRGRAFIAAKKNSDSTVNDVILVYNMRYKAWETPIEGINASSFYVRSGLLYATLTSGNDAYQVWTGTRDLATPTLNYPINAELRMYRQNFGSKHKRKEFDKLYIEGEMFQTGSVTFRVQYDEGNDVRSVTLQGTESGFFFTSTPTGAFGTVEFGAETFGPSGSGVTSSTDPVRFRLILSTKIRPFYTMQFRVVTSSYFKLIAYGPNTRLSRFVQPSSRYKALA